MVLSPADVNMQPPRIAVGGPLRDDHHVRSMRLGVLRCSFLAATGWDRLTTTPSTENLNRCRAGGEEERGADPGRAGRPTWRKDGTAVVEVVPDEELVDIERSGAIHRIRDAVDDVPAWSVSPDRARPGGYPEGSGTGRHGAHR